MRVLLAGSVSSFSGSQEINWLQAIERDLRRRKVEVDMFQLPFVQLPLLIPEQMMALRLLDVEDSCDILLTIGYPAFILRHPKKRVLLFSLAPSLHEHFDTEFGVLATAQHNRIRNTLKNTERKFLSEAEKIVCASKTLTTQLRKEHNLKSKTMILDDCFIYEPDTKLQSNLPLVVCESSLEPSDRIDLLLSAVACAKNKWQLHIFIPSASRVYAEALDQQISRLGLKDRVFVRNTALPVSTLKQVCAYISVPVASTRIPESAVRAVKATTPVITTSDSGAIIETLVNGTNGLVLKPSPMTIAQALDSITVDKKLQEKLSQSNSKFINTLSDVSSVTESLIG